MKQLVEFPMDGGGTMTVEVDVPETESAIARASRAGDVAEKAQVTFEDALGKVKPAAEGIIVRLQALSMPPDEIVVDFGLKLNASAGAILASAGGEANYNVTMTWRRKEQTEGS